MFTSKISTFCFFKGYDSIYPGVYGGFIAKKIADPDKSKKIYDSLVTIRTSSITVIDNPFGPVTMPGNYLKKEVFTQILRLKTGFESIRQNFTKGHKSENYAKPV